MTGWFEVGIMCPSGETFLPVYCCFGGLVYYTIQTHQHQPIKTEQVIAMVIAPTLLIWC